MLLVDTNVVAAVVHLAGCYVLTLQTCGCSVDVKPTAISDWQGLLIPLLQLIPRGAGPHQVSTANTGNVAGPQATNDQRAAFE